MIFLCAILHMLCNFDVRGKYGSYKLAAYTFANLQKSNKKYSHYILAKYSQMMFCQYFYWFLSIVNLFYSFFHNQYFNRQIPFKMISQEDSIGNHEQMLSHQAIQQERIQHNVASITQQKILTFIGCENQYKINSIPISDEKGFINETLFTIYIKSKKETDCNIYLGHGFGGSSLMYFPSIDCMRDKSNIVLWEIRGMGLNNKPNQYNLEDSEITDFFINGLVKIIEYYQHQNIIFMSHSFSAYILLRWIHKQLQKKQSVYINRIVKVILLSPVGITKKQDDYKNRIRSCGDFWNAFISKIGWKFCLTYKSILRTICSCCKNKILSNSFKSYGLALGQLSLIVQLFQALVFLQDGSQNLFFRYFEPRVLPKQGQSISELINDQIFPFPVKICFGQDDWADQKGSQLLAEQNKTTSVEIIVGSDHMLPLCKQALQMIIQTEIN